MSFFRRIAFSFCLGLLTGVPLYAADWMQPSPQQLEMTSDPAAPNAAAVYLYREEIVNDKLHYHQVYAVVKILTEKGKEDFGEIEIPYETGGSISGLSGDNEVNVSDVEGRTIEPDGTVVPFTGKPYRKQLYKFGDEKAMETAFSMPDIRIGSVIEFRYQIDYSDSFVEPPQWYIQQEYFVHQAHYHFVPTDTAQTIETTDAQGHTNAVNHLVWYKNLPGKADVVSGLDGIDLIVNNVPAAPDEPWMPPLKSFSYRLFFYYSPYDNGKEFWEAEGKYWSKDVDHFAATSGRIKAAVGQITSPGDTPDQKLQKIYAAVMTIENTDFTRQHTAQENKLEHGQIRTAADVWEQKRGTSNQITRLFIAMARAAGFKAWDMIVTDRDQSILNLGYLNWGQLSDELAIVNVDGKEQYFDPGERYCEFGKVAWVHRQMLGIRQTDGGTETAMVPAALYTDNQITRIADLMLDPDGKVMGQIRVVMNGSEALHWRQVALGSDAEATGKAYEKMMQARVPDGVRVKMDHFLGLTDPGSDLMAILSVSGSMGTATGKLAFVPAAFFEARVTPIFSAQTRENPIDLRYPYKAVDQVTVTLSPGLRVESLPQTGNVSYPQRAVYRAVYGQKGNVYEGIRVLELGSAIFETTDYPQLRSFFQGIGAQDQAQVVLDRTPVPAAAPVGKGQ